MRTFTKAEFASAKVNLSVNFKMGKVRVTTAEVEIKFSTLTVKEVNQLMKLIAKSKKVRKS